MKIPNAISLVVVEHDDRNMFLLPEGCGLKFVMGREVVETPEGALCYRAHPGCFSSYGRWDRETDTVCVVYRNDEFFCRGMLSYLGGQDSGYLTVGGFDQIETSDPHNLLARDFQVGDVITFLCLPNSRRAQQ